MLPISVCMIVKNEEALLAEALASVVDVVAEILVGDTGSTDGTKAVAARFGARILDVAWQDDFAGARNQVLAAATQPWVMRLDADEAIPPETWAWITDCLPKLAPAFYLCTRYDQQGQPRQNMDLLFPNRETIRYHGRIHETLQDLDGHCRPEAIAELRVRVFDHQRDAAREQLKQAWFLDLVAADLDAGWDARLVTHQLAGLIAAGRPDAVLSTYEQHRFRLETEPDAWGSDAATLTAKVLWNQSEHEGCLRHCDGALVVWPQRMALHLCRAEACEATGRWLDALDGYQETLRLWDSPDPWTAFERAAEPGIEAQALRHLLFLSPLHGPWQDLNPYLRRACLPPGETGVWHLHACLAREQVEEAVDLMLRAHLPPGDHDQLARLRARLQETPVRSLIKAKLYGLLPGDHFLQRAEAILAAANPSPVDDPEWRLVSAALAQRHADRFGGTGDVP